MTREAITFYAPRLFPHLLPGHAVASCAEIAMRRQLKLVVTLANERDGSEITLQTALANEAAIDEKGWALIAPYGEHPLARRIMEKGKPQIQRFIQVVDEEAVDTILANENTFIKTAKRAIFGTPVYKVHPDLKEYEPNVMNSSDNGGKKVTLGVIDKLRKCDRGLEARFALSRDAAPVLANEKLKYPSVLWHTNFIQGEDKKPLKRDGAFVVRPFELCSVGLTSRPNISGVDSLANAKPGPDAANTTKDPNTVMNDILRGWLAAKGITLANEASDTAVLDAIQRHCDALSTNVTTLTNEKVQLNTQVTSLNTEKTTLTSQITTLTNERNTARDNVKAERKARAELVADLVIAQGRAAVSERDGIITTLSNEAVTDFAAEAKKFTDKPVAHKVNGAAKTNNDAKTLANAGISGNPFQIFQNEVKAKMKTAGMSYDQAFDAVKTEKPELLQAK